jgi:hypothetical protein
MRPATIVAFESIIFATMGLGLVQLWLDWEGLTRVASAGFTLTVLLITFGLVCGLTLLVSRRRSKIAMWISIGLFVLGLPMVFSVAASGLLIGSAWVTALQTVGQLVAYGLLFTPSARSWLRAAPVIA